MIFSHPNIWNQLPGFVDVLQSFYIATKIEEGEKYVTLSSVIPVVEVLIQRTAAYIRNKDNSGYGITFAKNILCALEDRFGKSHNFMTLKPHCFSTFCDPRFKHLYFSKRPEVADVNRRVISLVRAEMEMMEVERTNVSVVSSDADDSFWKGFQKDAQTD